MRNANSSIARYLSSEDGAVTVDWVVLTAALVGLGVAAMAVVSNGVEDVSTDMATSLASADITNPFGEPVAPFERNQWTARTGGVEALETWIGGFEDQQLLDHMTNQAQYADGTQTGHPYDTYHDEFWVARDEAVTRGLIPADQPV